MKANIICEKEVLKVAKKAEKWEAGKEAVVINEDENDTDRYKTKLNPTLVICYRSHSNVVLYLLRKKIKKVRQINFNFLDFFFK
jgi:hypothetical protein